jgi:hypothetical protein
MLDWALILMVVAQSFSPKATCAVVYTEYIEDYPVPAAIAVACDLVEVPAPTEETSDSLAACLESWGYAPGETRAREDRFTWYKSSEIVVRPLDPRRIVLGLTWQEQGIVVVRSEPRLDHWPTYRTIRIHELIHVMLDMGHGEVPEQLYDYCERLESKTELHDELQTDRVESSPRCLASVHEHQVRSPAGDTGAEDLP